MADIFHLFLVLSLHLNRMESVHSVQCSYLNRSRRFSESPGLIVPVPRYAPPHPHRNPTGGPMIIMKLRTVSRLHMLRLRGHHLNMTKLWAYLHAYLHIGASYSSLLICISFHCFSLANPPPTSHLPDRWVTCGRLRLSANDSPTPSCFAMWPNPSGNRSTCLTPCPDLQAWAKHQ